MTAENQAGKMTANNKLRVVQSLFSLGIFLFLLWRLSLMGWKDILSQIPQSWLFYIILVLMFFILPVFNTICFSLLFRSRSKGLFSAILKSRIYDNEVLEYSGDVFLFFWAKNNMGLPSGRVAHAIKDNAIISGFANCSLSAVLLSCLFFIGKIPVFETIHLSGQLLGAVVIALTALYLAVFRYRKYFFYHDNTILLRILILTFARLILLRSLQLLQWVLLLTDIRFEALFTLLCVQIILLNLSFLPARDLFFMAASIELSVLLGIPASTLAGMTLASVMFNNILNLLSFIFITLASSDSFKDAFPSMKRVTHPSGIEREKP